MAAGDLSADQAAYARAVARATGLDYRVVVAWVGAESGWATTKASRNYLNIGPGRRYRSTSVAAAAAASLVNTSGHYAGIRAAIKSGDPIAQVRAIASSPWDTGRYGGDGRNLLATYRSVAGRGGVLPPQVAPPRPDAPRTIVDRIRDVGGTVVDLLPGGPGVRTIVGGAGGAAVDVTGDALETVTGGGVFDPSRWVVAGVTIVAATVGLGLVGLGIWTMTAPARAELGEQLGDALAVAGATRGA